MFLISQLVGFAARILNSTGVTETNPNGAPTGSTAWGDITYFDRSWQADANSTVFKIAVHSATGGTFTLKIAERTGAGNYTVLRSQSITHGGTGMEEITLVDPFEVPASGLFNIGAHINVTTAGSPSSSRAFKAGNVGLGAQTGFTEDTNVLPAVRVTY